MQYNADLYSLSRFLTSQEGEKEISKDIQAIQNKLLNILITKLTQHLNDANLGYLTVKFFNYKYKIDDGYQEITELLNTDNFVSFANQYCLYLNISNHFSYSCYEITWNYQAYFASFNKEEMFLKQLDSNTLSSFTKLNEDMQIKILSSFKENVARFQYLQKQTQLEKYCQLNGHNFANWTFINSKWQRVCTHCGFKEETLNPPKDIELAYLRKRIKKLEEQ